MGNENKDIAGGVGLVIVAPALEDCGIANEDGLDPCSLGFVVFSAGLAGMNGVGPGLANEKGEVDAAGAAAGNEGVGEAVGAAVFASGALKLKGEG